jgi:hypothetical protein
MILIILQALLPGKHSFTTLIMCQTLGYALENKESTEVKITGPSH